jgi:peptidoglycan hydrolase CwlO-like protein
MELAFFSVIFNTILHNLPIMAIFAIGAIVLVGLIAKKYLQTSYVPIKIYETDKKIIEEKEEKVQQSLKDEIDRINSDLMKYVLIDEFKEFKDKVEEKIDNLNDKIDALPNKINESESRIIDIFLKMFAGNK